MSCEMKVRKPARVCRAPPARCTRQRPPDPRDDAVRVAQIGPREAHHPEPRLAQPVLPSLLTGQRQLAVDPVVLDQAVELDDDVGADQEVDPADVSLCVGDRHLGAHRQPGSEQDQPGAALAGRLGQGVGSSDRGTGQTDPEASARQRQRLGQLGLAGELAMQRRIHGNHTGLHPAGSGREHARRGHGYGARGGDLGEHKVARVSRVNVQTRADLARPHLRGDVHHGEVDTVEGEAVLGEGGMVRGEPGGVRQQQSAHGEGIALRRLRRRPGLRENTHARSHSVQRPGADCGPKERG